MQEGPRVEKCPIAIIKITYKGMDVEVLVKITDRGF